MTKKERLYFVHEQNSALLYITGIKHILKDLEDVIDLDISDEAKKAVIRGKVKRAVESADTATKKLKGSVDYLYTKLSENKSE